MPRHPHLGHTALFALLTVCVLLPATAIILTLHLPQLLLLAATYCLTLTLAALLFPFIWNQPLSTGLHWNASAIKPRLFLLGPALAVLTQAIESLLPTPKDLPIDQILRTTPSLILLALFGTFLAPLFEEVLFRGFLLPSLALAVDYLRLPKSLESLEKWRAQTTFSLIAITLSTLITSILFALLHASQLGFYWPAVTLILAVSVVLCAVRFRTHSLAATVLVHTTYNATIFLTVALTTHRP